MLQEIPGLSEEELDPVEWISKMRRSEEVRANIEVSATGRAARARRPGADCTWLARWLACTRQRLAAARPAEQELLGLLGVAARH